MMLRAIKLTRGGTSALGEAWRILVEKSAATAEIPQRAQREVATDACSRLSQDGAKQSSPSFGEKRLPGEVESPPFDESQFADVR